MYYYNGRIQFPIKLFDFDTISETESYFLNIFKLIIIINLIHFY